MTPERWRNVDDLLCAVLEIEAEQRSACLDSAYSSNLSYGHEVETLLDSGHDARSSLLESPPMSALLTHDTRTPRGWRRPFWACEGRDACPVGSTWTCANAALDTDRLWI